MYTHTSIFVRVLMCSLILSLLLGGLCLREVLAPNVFPGDTTHEADSSRPRCPEAETQKVLPRKSRALSGHIRLPWLCRCLSSPILLLSPSVPAASLATVCVSLACFCSTRVTAKYTPSAGPGGFCAAQPSFSSPDSSGPTLWAVAVMLVKFAQVLLPLLCFGFQHLVFHLCSFSVFSSLLK